MRSLEPQDPILNYNIASYYIQISGTSPLNISLTSVQLHCHRQADHTAQLRLQAQGLQLPSSCLLLFLSPAQSSCPSLASPHSPSPVVPVICPRPHELLYGPLVLGRTRPSLPQGDGSTRFCLPVLESWTEKLYGASSSSHHQACCSRSGLKSLIAPRHGRPCEVISNLDRLLSMSNPLSGDLRLDALKDYRPVSPPLFTIYATGPIRPCAVESLFPAASVVPFKHHSSSTVARVLFQFLSTFGLGLGTVSALNFNSNHLPLPSP